MAKRISVVMSQGQSKDPAKRKLEETIVAELMLERGVDVLIIPHLYDVRPGTPADIALQGLTGDFVLLSWLYPRAAHWILDRNAVRGRMGETKLKSGWDKRKRKKTPEELNKSRVLDGRPATDRAIYHIDLRGGDKAQVYIEEVKRIAAEQATAVVDLAGGLAPRQLASAEAGPAHQVKPVQIGDQSGRRWYPVIDFSRCTNCMECIDFCLFGVYGVDVQETILVEQPDNCRKGCPACSRVCPENAIIFPQHKTPAIAGDPSVGAEMKIDLSQLFGGQSAPEVAARERDEQLIAAGRQAVGAAAGKTNSPVGVADPRDELDDLIDELDQMDL